MARFAVNFGVIQWISKLFQTEPEKNLYSDYKFLQSAYEMLDGVHKYLFEPERYNAEEYSTIVYLSVLCFAMALVALGIIAYREKEESLEEANAKIKEQSMQLQKVMHTILLIREYRLTTLVEKKRSVSTALEEENLKPPTPLTTDDEYEQFQNFNSDTASVDDYVEGDENPQRTVMTSNEDDNKNMDLMKTDENTMNDDENGINVDINAINVDANHGNVDNITINVDENDILVGESKEADE